jgi:hypothetical protein
MTPVEALRRAAERTASEADALSAAFARQLARVFRDTDRQIREWLFTQPERLRPTARGDIRRIVHNAGFDALATASVVPFDDIAAQVISSRRAAKVAVDVSASAVARLEAWREWHLADVLDEASVLSRGLAAVVMRSDGRSRRRLPNDLAKVLDSAESRVLTLYDTAVSIFGRQVEAEQAGDDPSTTFVYMGPVDAKTRDFCLEHVGKVYTREEIDELDNGQLSNVFLTAGGWNCRHVFQEISKASELRETGEAPEIRQEVERIRLKEAA